MILDYSELHSISGKEKEGGAHQYVAIDAQTGRKNNDILAEKNACHVDGEAALFYKNAVYSFILTIDYEHNDMVVSGMDDSNIGFDISWDGVYFTITYVQNHSALAVKYFSPYSSWLAQYNTKEKRVAEINKAVRIGGENVDVPFLFYDGVEYKSDNYYHPETALSEQSWAVVVNPALNTTYFKNMSDENSVWEEATSSKWQY